MNNEVFVKIQVSAPVYWGYSFEIEASRLQHMTRDDIINELKQHMHAFFRENNLLELAEGVPRLDLHIHGDIRQVAGNGNTIYVCAHD
jgi:hypothetical protein